MKQKEKVLNYLKEHGSIDRPTAMANGVWNLPDVIMRLRADGHAIRNEKINKRKSYVRYVLEGE